MVGDKWGNTLIGALVGVVDIGVANNITVMLVHFATVALVGGPCQVKTGGLVFFSI